MRRWSWLVLVLVCLVASPAFAAEGPEHADADAHGGNITDVDPFAVAMAIGVFLVLLVVLSKFAWRPILAGLKAREATIQKAVDDAHAASEQARAVMRQYEGKLATANEEARAILEESRRDALALKASIETDARRAAEETGARAVRDIEQARVTAWDGLVRDAARMATDVAARIIRKSLDAQGHAALVDEVVSEVVAARRGSKS
jgi:F-type H+-transporting ATPase subunit b